MWVCRPSLFLCLCLWHQVTIWGTCQVKLSSACGILAYSVHCSRELEPDFVSFCLFLIGCHRSISTVVLSAFEPMDLTPFFFQLESSNLFLKSLVSVPLQGKPPLAVFAQSGRWGKGGLKTLPPEHVRNTDHTGGSYFSIQRFTPTILLSLKSVFKNSKANAKYSIASHFSSQIRSVLGVTWTAGRQLEGKIKGQPEDLISFNGNNLTKL